MFDWIRKLRSASAERKLMAWHVLGRPAWPMRDPSAFAREGYGRNAIAYRCVRMIAEAAASAPLKVGPRDHPLARLLMRPNPEQTGVELLEAFYGHLQVSGNAYLEAAGIDCAAPSELYVLRPDRTQVVPGADGWPVGWAHRVGANVRRFERDPVTGDAPILHLKLFNPGDDWYGLSPMEAAGYAIDIHNAGGAWNKALIDNAARPSGALVFSGVGGADRLSEDQFRRLKHELEEMHAGAANAGRPMLLEGGLEWRPMSLTPADMEYSGHQPQDGSGDVFFHLDPLWADANIDAVGVDWYPPLTDWRAGATHLDAALSQSIHDPDYLRSRIEAGENYDFFYASDADRAAQLRTPITDGAYGEPWIYRAKDVRNFWARAHHNRPGGVRDAAPTAWVPESKPVWLVELGCPAVDKGANAPNLFTDVKSAESALPPFSSGARDDLVQQRALDAYLRHWDVDAGDNPISALTGKPMIAEIMLWAWDARPHPAFPGRADVWADGAAWRLGHWLNGRAGLSGLGEVVLSLCARAGVEDADVSQLIGAVSGYVVDAPASARAALEPLMAAYDFTAGEREGRICFAHRSDAAVEIGVDDFAADAAADAFAQRGDAAEAPVEARVRFLDAARDYLIAGVGARRLDSADGGVESIDAPLVLETDAAEAIAQRVLADRRAAAETLGIALGPAHVALEPGDAIRLHDGADAFEIVRIEDAETRRLEVRRARAAVPGQLGLVEPGAPPAPLIAPTPALAVLDLPPLPGAESDERPLAAAFASPWLGPHEVYAGSTLTRRAACASPAVMGELLWALWPGPVDRWDGGNVVRVKLYGGVLTSASREAVLDGANAFAIEAGGEYEIVQARSCVLVGPNEYELSGFLRGRLGSAHAMRAPHPVGARIVALNDRLARVEIGAHEWNEALAFAAPPAGRGSADPRALQLTATLSHAAVRSWAPAHVRARRGAGGDVEISWVRCARIGGDAWGASEPPLGASAESYRLEILDGGEIVRAVTVGTAAYAYAAADQTADFGGLPGSLHIRVAQIGDGGATGLNSELTITL